MHVLLVVGTSERAALAFCTADLYLACTCARNRRARVLTKLYLTLPGCLHVSCLRTCRKTDRVESVVQIAEAVRPSVTNPE